MTLDLYEIENAPMEELPAILAQLASAQALVASRLASGSQTRLDEGRWIGKAEAMSLLDVSERTLRRITENLKEGVHFRRIGRSLLYSVADLAEFAEESRGEQSRLVSSERLRVAS